jgi:hypothetical protein
MEMIEMRDKSDLSVRHSCGHDCEYPRLYGLVQSARDACAARLERRPCPECLWQAHEEERAAHHPRYRGEPGIRTALVPVIYGYGPDGGEGGEARVIIPRRVKPSTFRSRVAAGTIALSGPSSVNDARAGCGYRFLSPAGDAWSVDGSADVVS